MNFIDRHKNGQLYIDGLSVADLTDQFGTPLYIYSGNGFIHYYRQFATAIAALDNHIHYAVKANSSIGILTLLARAGAGADIVSIGEMYRAMRANIAPKNIIFSGVGKTDSEIYTALKTGIGQINAESVSEIYHIKRIASEMSVIAPVALRVNVNIDAGSHAKISTGERSTKFGIAIASGEAADCYQLLADDPHIQPKGLAVHIGSQINQLDKFKTAYTELLDFAQQLRSHNLPVDNLDLGGGLGVDYQSGGLPDFTGYGKLVTDIFSPHDYKLGFEPGRAIAADNGILLTEVIYIKQGEDKRFIIVNAAMNDLIRPTLYEAYHRIEPIGKAGPVIGKADIVGPICETGDYLAQNRDFPEINEGEILAVFSAGAYGSVMMSTYNTRPEAAEIMILDGKIHILRERQTIDDLLDRELNPLG